MNKKKLGLMLASTALIASAVLFGTLAYFTDSESVANTFTVGNIDITLDEAMVNQYGEPEKDGEGNVIRQEKGNEYKLVPGKTYVKDPTVTVEKGSESAYVRMIVYITESETVTKVFNALSTVRGTEVKPIDMFNNLDKDHWIEVEPTKITSTSSLVYEFRYYDKDNDTAIVEADSSADKVLPALFASFTVPGEINGKAVSDLANMQIIVVGEAIQADSFEAETDDTTGAVTKTAEEVAWEAFNAQAGQTGFDAVYDSTTTTP